MPLEPGHETYTSLRATRTAHQVASAVKNPPLERQRRWIWVRPPSGDTYIVYRTNRGSDMLAIFGGIALAVGIVVLLLFLAR